MSDIVLVAIITGGFIILNTVITLIVNHRLGNIHKQINSRMDELVQTTKDLGHSEGMAEEKSRNK